MPMWPSHSGIKSHSGSWHIQSAGTVFFRRRQSAQLVLPSQSQRTVPTSKLPTCHHENREVFKLKRWATTRERHSPSEKQSARNRSHARGNQHTYDSSGGTLSASTSSRPRSTGHAPRSKGPTSLAPHRAHVLGPGMLSSTPVHLRHMTRLQQGTMRGCRLPQS
jgi:hypothetical protein